MNIQSKLDVKTDRNYSSSGFHRGSYKSPKCRRVPFSVKSMHSTRNLHLTNGSNTTKNRELLVNVNTECCNLVYLTMDNNGNNSVLAQYFFEQSLQYVQTISFHLIFFTFHPTREQFRRLRNETWHQFIGIAFITGYIVIRCIHLIVAPFPRKNAFLHSSTLQILQAQAELHFFLVIFFRFHTIR